MAKELNLHAHHRSRLRSRFITEGHLNFEEHNMLELILFYGIPYKDTNPIAHQLINRFGSISNILKTDTSLLTEISNVGNYTAEFLHTLEKAKNAFLISNQKKRSVDSFKSTDEMGKHLCDRFKNEKSPFTAVVFLNNGYEIVGVKKLLDRANGLHLLKTEDIMSSFINAHAASLVLFQYKPNSVALPEIEDIYSAMKLKNDLSTSEIKLLEFFVISDSSYTQVFSKSSKIVKNEDDFSTPTAAANDGYAKKKAILQSNLKSVKDDTENDNLSESDFEILSSLLRFASKNRAEKLASALLEKYNTLHRVFSTDINELLCIEGINENTATLLRLVGALPQYIIEKTPQKDLCLSDERNIILFLSKLYVGESLENAIILLFDKNKKFIKLKRLPKGSISFINISSRDILEAALKAKASYVIISHNHPNGAPVPSLADKESTKVIEHSLSSAGIELYAHYIIAGTEYSNCMST